MSLTITTIPTELIGEIASHLSDLDHSALRMTCKSMHSKIGTARILGEDGMCLSLPLTSLTKPS